MSLSIKGKFNVQTIIATTVKLILIAAALLAIVTCVEVMVRRIAYPFDLEWGEGGTVDHVARLLQGKPLYAPPSLEFVTFIYPPLYWWISAFAAKIIGLGYVPLRLVSILSTILAFVSIILLVWSDTKKVWSGVLAAGLYATMFGISGAWYDIARSDSMYVALTLLGAFFAYRKPSLRSYMIAALCFTGAFLAKQTALAVIGAVIVSVFFVRPRLALYLAIATTAGIGISVLILNITTNGWFYYYVFTLPQVAGLASDSERFVSGFVQPLAIALILAHLYLLWTLTTDWRKALRWAAFMWSAIGTALLATLHEGGWFNVFMPACAAVAVVCALAVQTVVDRIPRPPSPATRIVLHGVLCAAACYICLMQFQALQYDPNSQIPSAQDEAAGRNFIQRLAAIKGPVFVPNPGYIPTLAGKNTSAFDTPVWDVRRGPQDVWIGFQQEFGDAIRSQKFGAIVLSNWMIGIVDDVPFIQQYYEPATEPLFTDPSVFFPVDGARVRPDVIYIPRKQR